MKNQRFYSTHSPNTEKIPQAISSTVFQNSLRAYNTVHKVENPTNIEKLAKQIEQQLQKRQEKVNKNKKRQLALKKKFFIVEELLKEAIMQLKNQQEQELLMQQASIKIQKVFKGFITRKKLEPVRNK